MKTINKTIVAVSVILAMNTAYANDGSAFGYPQLPIGGDTSNPQHGHTSPRVAPTIAGNHAAITGNSGKISALETSANDLGSSIISNKNNIDRNKLASLSNGQTASRNENGISSNLSKLNILERATNGALGRLDGLDSKTDEIKRDTADAMEAARNIDSGLKTANTNISDNVDSINDNTSGIAANKQVGTANNGSIKNLASGLASAQSRISDEHDRVTGNFEALSTNKDGVHENKSSIDRLTEGQNTTRHISKDQRHDIDANTSEISDARTDTLVNAMYIDYNTDGIKEAMRGIVDNYKGIDKNTDSIEDNTTNIGINAGSITKLQQHTDAVDTNIVNANLYGGAARPTKPTETESAIQKVARELGMNGDTTVQKGITIVGTKTIENKNSIEHNTGGIKRNITNIHNNAGSIKLNSSNISSNSGAIKSNRKEITSLRSDFTAQAKATAEKFNKVNKRIDGTQAMMQAVVNARPYVANGDTAVGVGMGYASGSKALAVGVAHSFQNTNWSMSSTANVLAMGGSTDFSMGVGAQYTIK